MENSSIRICFGGDYLPDDAIASTEITETLEERTTRTVVLATLNPDSNSFQWDYASQVTVFNGDELIFTGTCVQGVLEDDGSLKLRFEGALRELERTVISNLVLFGMNEKEKMYHLALLAGAKGAEVEGLALDTQFRPFIYAVPLLGLKAEGPVKSISINDLGVAAGEADDAIFPLIDNLELPERDPLWQKEIPRAFGVVFAKDLIEAEELAWRKAELTADIINFALRAGLSHLHDRLSRHIIEWNDDIASSQVKAAAWILIREVRSIKGWAREVPWSQIAVEPDLHEVHGRLTEFVNRLGRASVLGDALDQTGRRHISERERRLFGAIQRSLRWYAIASSEEEKADKFLALWVALEAILEGMEYPRVFGKDRELVKQFIAEQLPNAPYPSAGDPLLSMTPDFLAARLNNEQWPMARKLSLFAESFGIPVQPSDRGLVRELGRVRGRILHSGDLLGQLDYSKVRQLEYLVERLVIAAAVGAYLDIEDDQAVTIRIGQVPPKGGTAPIFLDGREVDYLPSGNLEEEILIEGKVYKHPNIRFAPG